MTLERDELVAWAHATIAAHERMMGDVDKAWAAHRVLDLVKEVEALKSQVAAYAVGSAGVVATVEHLNQSAFDAGRRSATAEVEALRVRVAAADALCDVLAGIALSEQDENDVADALDAYCATRGQS